MGGDEGEAGLAHRYINMSRHERHRELEKDSVMPTPLLATALSARARISCPHALCAAVT